jgi:hypothetical protein
MKPAAKIIIIRMLKKGVLSISKNQKLAYIKKYSSHIK